MLASGFHLIHSAARSYLIAISAFVASSALLRCLTCLTGFLVAALEDYRHYPILSLYVLDLLKYHWFTDS